MDITQYQEMLQREWEEYEDSVRQALAQNRKIVLYGAGLYGRKLLKRLRASGMVVSAFAVTKVQYNLSEFSGLPVKSIDELISEKKSYFYLIAVKPASQKAIVRELTMRRISDYLPLPEHAEELLDDTFFRPVMEITPRIGCSVNCHFCPQPLLLHRYGSDHMRQREMTLADFQRYIDKLPQDCIIDFSGFVEPFLAKDGLEMVKYAHESGRDVRLFTTLVGLTLEKFHEIEDIPFKLVVLHLPDVKGYANIPMTEEYLRLLRYVVEKRRPDGSHFVDSANCQCEPCPEVVKIINNRIMISWDMVDRAGNLDDASLRSAKSIKGAIRCGRSLETNHNVLLPNGDVVLCCMDFGMTRILGNLKNRDYEEIINGAALRAIVHKNGNGGDTLCQKCTYARIMGGDALKNNL